ncbi:MAG: glycosyltransferase family 4 protein [Gaiellaceae bacterium]
MSRPRVVLLRGHWANPWELGAWELLSDRFDVSVAVTASNAYEVGRLRLAQLPIGSLRDRLPSGRLGDLAIHVPGDRYFGLEDALRGADVVHTAELGEWFAAQPARLKSALGFRLVVTVWGTIPFLPTFLDRVRGPRWAAATREVLAAADLYLATTERARTALVLEGVDPARVAVAAPGIDTERFAAARAPARDVIVSPGRLVWEKGHFDVLRALALLSGERRLLIVGAGRERERLLRHAAELGVADRVEIRSVPYDEMPAVFARAEVVVLASLATPAWEEQFGMVLAEALAAGAPVVASRSGAIPEVLAGSSARLFEPGDWPELARLLDETPPAADDSAVVARYSREAAAERLAAAYERVLGRMP